MKRSLRFFVPAAIILALVPFLNAKALTGDLVRSHSLPAVYYINADGKRIAFPDEATFFSWYPDFSAVQFVSDEELARHALGGTATMRPGTRVVKTAISPKVYAVAHGGILRWIASEEIAKVIFGADWSRKVAVIDESLLTDYGYGADITAGGQYWWRQEKDASPDILADREEALAPGYVAPPAAAESPVSSSPAPVAVAETEGKNVLYILWDPKRPQYAQFDKTILERVLFGRAPSMADYYAEESDNHIKIENAGVLGWYSADKGPDYYWLADVSGDNSGFKSGEAAATAEALKKADADFDFSRYDADSDGSLSPEELGIFIVVPQAGGEDLEFVTPYASEAQTKEVESEFEPGVAPTTVTETIPAVVFKADGVTIPIVGKLYTGMALGDDASFGLFLYSFAKHVMKLGDLSAGSFSLMSDHTSSLRLDPYSRLQLGWLSPKVIPKNTEVSNQFLESNTPGRTVLKIDSEATGGSGGRYFLIENRLRGTFYDNDLPDEGVAVWEGSTLRRLDSTTPVNDAYALWREHGGHYSPTALELYWSDGKRSGVRMVGLKNAEQVVTFTLEKKILTDVELAAPPSAIR